MDFDPNQVGIANGNIFGFPVIESEADIVIIPVPWDVTASYGKGTSGAPQAILEASTQLDFYHPQVQNAHLTKVFMSPISQEWKDINDQLLPKSQEYIRFLENGGQIEQNALYIDVLAEINQACQILTQNLQERASDLLQNNQCVGILGGEHSVPLGLIQALDQKYSEFGILQIDAHADLRESYEGFSYSHASIMFNVLKNCPHVVQLTQVGVRDIAPSEIDFIQQNKHRITTFFDWTLKDNHFQHISWHSQVHKIIATLPQKVYISFDIDGLCPDLCPHTGTPVAGGLRLEEATYLLFELIKTGRTIIGFDLNEVGTSDHSDWDANVGARVLWNLVCATQKSIQ